MSLLLLSSSRVADSAYLATAQQDIYHHLAGCNNIVFIPYAGVTMTHDVYLDKVQTALPDIELAGIHQGYHPRQVIDETDAIVVGGGNTFHLLSKLYEHNLIDQIKQKVESGTKYVGWSAGANVAGLSIKTTNDMPIIEPPSFDALKLLPFQINPHYTDYQAPGHNGETREERLQEFMSVNRDTAILALPEGTGVTNSGSQNEQASPALSLVGIHSCFVFKDKQKLHITDNEALNSTLF